MCKSIPMFILIVLSLSYMPPALLFDQDQWRILPERSGKWSYTYHNEPYGPNAEKNYKLTPTEIAAIKQKLAVLAEVIRHNPLGVNPVGYDAVAIGSFCCYDETTSLPIIPLAKINLSFYSLWGDIAGNVKRYWGEAPDIDCYLNNIKPLACSFFIEIF